MVDPILLFQQARTLLCLCPCCGKIVRISDLSLRYKGVTPKTWLDTYEKRVSRLEAQEEQFEEQEEAIRELARERGRKKALKTMKNLIQTALPGCQYDPKDIKAVLDPIDFVVFCGMATQPKIDKIALLSKATEIPRLNKIRQSIQTAISDEAYEWHVVRVKENGDILIE